MKERTGIPFTVCFQCLKKIKSGVTILIPVAPIQLDLPYQKLGIKFCLHWVGFVHSVKKEKGKKKKGYSVVFLKQSNEHCLISMVETSRLSIVSLPESFFQEKFTSPSSSYLSFYTWIIVGGWTVSLAFRSWSVWSYIRLSSLGWFVLAFLVVYFGGVRFGFVLGLLFCFQI